MKNIIRFSIIFGVIIGCVIYSNSFCKEDQGTRYLMPPNPEVYNDTLNKDRKIKGSGTLDINDFTQDENNLYSSINYSAPVNGTAEKLLIIPIEFDDVKFGDEFDTEYFASIMNQLRDYYEDNSQYVEGTRGMTIDFTIAEPVCSVNTMEYYGEDDGNFIDAANGNIGNLAKEAVQLLDMDGFNFSSYDRDSNGVIDHIVIVHAGMGQESSLNTDLIWSHAYVIPSGGYTVDGKKALNYTCIPENFTLGVIAHEFGHDLGLPDLYDTDGIENGESNGVGNWDVMGSGSWNYLPGEAPGSTPSNLSAWSRVYLGWATPTSIRNNTNRTITNDDGFSSILRLWPDGNLSSGEYYLIEYRRKIGYDEALPGQGILVWHIHKELIDLTYNYNMVNAFDEYLGVELEQADGNYDLWWCENYGDDGDPFPGSSENTNFNAVPYRLNYSNEYFSKKDNHGEEIEEPVEDLPSTYIEIRNIQLNGNTASASYFVEESKPTQAPQLKAPANESLVDAQPTFNWSMVNNAKQYKLQIAENTNFTAGLREILLDDNINYIDGYYSYKLNMAQKLDGNKTYYWRIAGKNDLSTNRNIVWSAVNMIRVIPNGQELLSEISNIKTQCTNDTITLSWDNTVDATGYYILIDGTEIYVDTNEYEDNDLESFTRRKYRIRAVDDTNTSSWSDEIIEYTIGAPSLDIDTGDVVKGSENGCTVDINIVDGTFREDGVFNKGTVIVYSDRLPNGVEIGNISKQDEDTLQIQLLGNSSEDYEFDEAFVIKILKEEIVDGRYEDLYIMPIPQDIDFSYDGENAGALLGSTTDMEYSINGWKYNSITENDMVIPTTEINAANNIEIRYKKKAALPASRPFTIDIQQGPEAPEVEGDDDLNTVTGIDNTMEYSTDGVIWTKYEGILPSLDGYVTLRVRFSATGVTTAGDIAMLEFTIPGPEGITFSFDGENAGKLLGSTTDMEYSIDGATYNAITENDMVIPTANINAENDIKIRYKATEEDLASLPSTIDILQGPEAPNVEGDDDLNTVTGIDNTMEYSTDGVIWTKYNDNLPSLESFVTLRIRVSATGITAAGSTTTIEFTIPGPEGITFSFDGENAGKLLGSTTDMEYSIDGATYNAITENDMVIPTTNITAENDIKIRYKATEELPASLSYTINILQGPGAPAVSRNDKDNTVSGINNTMEFSTDGVNWTKYNNSLPDLAGNITLRVRIAATGTTLYGGQATLVFTKSSSGGGGGGGGGGFFPDTSTKKPNINEEITKQINSKSEELVVVINTNLKEKSIEIDQNTLNTLKQADKELTVKSEVAEIILSKEAFDENLLKQAGKDAKFKISAEYIQKDEMNPKQIPSKEVLGPLFTAVDGKTIEFSAEVITKDKTQYINTFKQKITISIPLDDASLKDFDTEKLAVYHFNENTDKWDFVGGRYNAKTKSIVFSTNHFSLYTIMQYNKTFTDVKSHWAREDIEKMASRYIAQGRDENTFDPNSTITRAEFTALLVRALELKEAKSGYIPFGDINRSKWYSKEMANAYNAGIILKEDGVSFRPEVEITREEMVVLISRALKIKGHNIALTKELIEQKLENFEDMTEISESAKEPFAICITNKIVQGRSDTILAPKDNATRAEAIVIIRRILNID